MGSPYPVPSIDELHDCRSIYISMYCSKHAYNKNKAAAASKPVEPATTAASPLEEEEPPEDLAAEAEPEPEADAEPEEWAAAEPEPEAAAEEEAADTVATAAARITAEVNFIVDLFSSTFEHLMKCPPIYTQGKRGSPPLCAQVECGRTSLQLD